MLNARLLEDVASPVRTPRRDSENVVPHAWCGSRNEVEEIVERDFWAIRIAGFAGFNVGALVELYVQDVDR